MAVYRKRGEELIPIEAEKEIGRGGEAKVFKISSYEAIKVWRRSKRAKKAKKVKVMVENPLPSPDIAWPKELIYTEKGEIAGYVMPFYPGGEPLEKLIRADQVSKLFFLPSHFHHFLYTGDRVTFWKNRIEIGLNLLNLLRELHSHSIKIVVGDLKPENILIFPDGRVKLVDTDGFQVKEFPADSVTLEYVPPEFLENKVSREVGFSELWDYYIFGVILYRLLFGIPPYVGTLREGHTGDPNDLKKKRKFPFGRSREEFEVLPQLREGLQFEFLIPELQELFIRNFEGYIRERPTLEEWTKALIHQQNILNLQNKG